MIVTDIRKISIGEVISATDIPIGTCFTGKILGIGFENMEKDNYLFVRSFERIVSLNNPEHTWDLYNTVIEYQPVEVEIVIKKNLVSGE